MIGAFVGKFRKMAEIHHVSLTLWKDSAPNGRIFMKFDAEDLIVRFVGTF
jgi:hypothetical protein